MFANRIVPYDSGLASAKKYVEPIHMGKGIPVPHAEYIEGLMKRVMFPNKTDDQSFLELYGDVSDLDNASLARLQTLEYSVLDADNVKLYAKLARRCMERSQALEPQVQPQNSSRRFYSLKSAFESFNLHMIKTLLSLMQQSIYNTRLMLQRTNTLRARYRSDISFNIGQMYGTLMELKTKGARAISTVIKLIPDYDVKLVWYLLLYERILQIHTDATTTVQRIFMLNSGGAKSVINEDPEGDKHRSQQKRKNKKLTVG